MKRIAIIVSLGLTTLAQAQQTTPKSGAVHEVAANPKQYLGNVALSGVVAAVTPGKGFILVDQREYDACGISCLYERGTAKVPVQWTGDAPMMEAHLRVEGILSESGKGLSFVGKKISEDAAK